MRSSGPVIRAFAAGCAGAALLACGGGSGGGGAGTTGSGETYTSVGSDPSTLELKSGGSFVFTMAGLEKSEGTYTVDGEKVLITLDGRTHTLLKTGACLEDQLHVFSRMCIGGKAGEAASGGVAAGVAGIDAPSGTWVAKSDEGDFTLEFKPGNKLTLTATPPGGQPQSREGSYTMEGRVLQATLEQSEPLTLTFVNNTYESTSFGFTLRFVKR